MSPPFPRILCAVDGSNGANVALEQALALAGSDARVTLASVWADLADEPLASGALGLAAARAREAGMHAPRRLLHGPRAAEALAAAAPGFDLLVIGTHPHSRASGIVHGETATLLAHRSPVPLLIARERPLAAGVLAAADGHVPTRPALTAAARVAAHFGAELTVLHIREADESARRTELETELTNLRALLGRDVRYLTDFGGAAARIVAAAEAEDAGLVVVGSGGKQGAAALSSTSERVAHRAPCSVLIHRHR
jgi:nucleotide-binding universal stress UspA family protein